ncbi:MAG: hypothetical protein GX206_07340 [Clostridiales bacterium]|nr:hypothetical protein [Clostridiales bacterium]
MAKSFSVDLIKLESNIKLIDEKIVNYENKYQQLLQEIRNLETAWQGVDSSNFFTQINEFTGNMIKVLDFMKQYSMHLKFAMNTYREAQEEIEALAKAL